MRIFYGNLTLQASEWSWKNFASLLRKNWLVHAVAGRELGDHLSLRHLLTGFAMTTFQLKQLSSTAFIAINTIRNNVPLPGTAVLVGSTFATQAKKEVTASGSTITKQLTNHLLSIYTKCVHLYLYHTLIHHLYMYQIANAVINGVHIALPIK